MDIISLKIIRYISTDYIFVYLNFKLIAYSALLHESFAF